MFGDFDVTDVIADVSLALERLLDSLGVVARWRRLEKNRGFDERETTRRRWRFTPTERGVEWENRGWDASLRVREAQVWLSLRALLCDASCRRGYEWDEQRKSTVLKLGRYLNETKMDQLPVLRDLAGVLEEIRALDVTNVTDASRGFILEIVPSLRRAFTSKSKYSIESRRRCFASDSIPNPPISSEPSRRISSRRRDSVDDASRAARRSSGGGDDDRRLERRRAREVDIMRERRSLNDSEISFDLIRALEYDFPKTIPWKCARAPATRACAQALAEN